MIITIRNGIILTRVILQIIILLSATHLIKVIPKLIMEIYIAQGIYGIC